MNYTILCELKLLGTSYKISFDQALPVNRNIVFVSNHQSMFDIALIIWHLRRHSPRFIAKKELARWIPSVSFALRHMGSAWIDRADARSALEVIRQFGLQTRLASSTGTAQSVCIFPEGTRARDGVIKPFKVRGLMALIAEIPDAVIVPLAISNSWQIVRNKLFPIPLGLHIKLRVLAPIKAEDYAGQSLVKEIEQRIREEVLANS